MERLSFKNIRKDMDLLVESAPFNIEEDRDVMRKVLKDYWFVKRNRVK